MKLNRSLKPDLAAMALLFVAASLSAAPLAWFPGPPVDPPFSRAATVVASGLGNVLIGGDAFADYFFPVTYPQYLIATNLNWGFLSPIDSLNIAPGAVANGDMIVLYGGTDGTNSTSAVTAYSTSGDTTPELPSMSVARSYLGYAPDRNGRAYAIGGLDDSGQPLSSAERFNLDSNTWAPIASLPTALYNFPAVFDHTNRIYVFGGRTNTAFGTETPAVLSYSVSANTWIAVAPMPLPVAGSAAALAGAGKIYVVGGVSGGVTTHAVQVYDIASNSWVISTPLPEALSASAMGVDSLGRLIVMGGMDPNGNDVPDVWRSQQLGVPDSAPTFTQYPATNADFQVAYASTINATGSPPPVYLLLNGPVGMQVDPYTGAIAWTPQGADQIGTIPVTIRATNYAGDADWAFNITANPPPPTAPTNLIVVSETETSVTLSWDPEDPLVGPVTYSVFERHVLYKTPPKYVLVASNLPSPSATVSGLAVGSSHTYAVAAVAAGATSSRSQNITITTLKPQPAPNFRVTALTSTSTSLAWDPSPGPVPIAYFSLTAEIYTGQVTNTLEASLTGITNTSLAFSGQTPGSTHYYFLYAHDASGNPSSAAILTTHNPAPAPATLSNFTPAGSGGFQFTVQGSAIQTTLIQATTNLADPTFWETIATNPPTTTTFTFTDPNAGLFPARFYRVISP